MIISNALPIQFWLDGQQSFNDKVVSGITPVCFCLPFQCNETILFQGIDTVAANKLYSLKVFTTEGALLTTISFTREQIGLNYIYSLSFEALTYDICDISIKFKIVSSGPTPEIWESDCVYIRTYHPLTVSISYSNSKNFSNLVYSGLSVPPTFNIRIPAIFFEEDTSTEQEDLELSNGEIVRLYNKLELKRKLDIGFMPPYMHQKMQQILMHDTITIDGKEWIRRDGYEKIEGDKNYPLKRASVNLHDKTYIRENQL